MEQGSWDVKPYQRALWNIFKEFERICLKYNFRYYADGGTALGAVRHKGFIPWDDDLDVNMPREDYNKFVKVVRSELPSCYEFRRGGESEDAPIYFSKIVDVREGVVESLRKATKLNITAAPFIDIFILDGIPERTLDMRKWWNGRRRLRMCQLYRYPKSANASGGCWHINTFFARIIGFFLSPFYPKTSSNDQMMDLLDEYAMKWPFDKSKTVVDAAFYRGRTCRLMPKSYFDPALRMPFEADSILVPAQVENFLERSFGDYMKLPPCEARIPEHAFKRAYNHI